MLKEKTYRKALKASWQLAWHHKMLWVFGLFAAFLGQMGLLELFAKVAIGGTKAGISSGTIISDLSAISALINTLAFSLEGWLLLIWMGVLFGAIGILLVFISVSSQGALIDSAAQFIENEELPKVDQAWHTGTHHFWRLLLINILKKGIIFFLSVLVGYGAINVAIRATAVDYWIFVVLMASSVIIGAVVSFLAVYAACYVIIDESSLKESLIKAYKLFLDHWLVSVEIGVTILAINIFLIFLILASLFLLFTPTVLLWVIAVTMVSKAFYIAGIIIATLIFLLFVAFVASIFKVFTTSAWTYLFMKMHHHGIGSRILHWWGFHKLKK